MRLLQLITLFIAAGWAGTADAQLQLLPDREQQTVFAGDGRPVSLVWHSASDSSADMAIRARISQTSSATTMFISESDWKELQMLPGQTVEETARLNFPQVRAGTKFLVQWLQDSNTVLGRTEIMVYPTNLLEQIKPLAGDIPIGVLDPENVLIPLFKNLKIDFTDLQGCDLGDFSGRLAIIGPFANKSEMRDGLAGQVRALAKKGAAIVWFQPPPDKSAKLMPSFYEVPFGTNAVLVVQGHLADNLEANPQTQLNLIFFCQLALNPQRPTLPGLTSQPSDILQP